MSLLKRSNPVDFSLVAMQEPPAEDIVERKVCEGICGGYFFRRRQSGDAVCPRCVEGLRRIKSEKLPVKSTRPDPMSALFRAN